MKTLAVFPLCLALLTPPAWAREPGPELEARVVRVMDGDTIKVRLLGRMPKFFRVQSVRLRHCDAPELRDKRPWIAAKARAAKEFVEDRVSPGMHLTLKDVGKDKYGGRVLADIVVRRKDLCRELLEAGLAVPYEGGKRGW